MSSDSLIVGLTSIIPLRFTVITSKDKITIRKSRKYLISILSNLSQKMIRSSYNTHRILLCYNLPTVTLGLLINRFLWEKLTNKYFKVKELWQIEACNYLMKLWINGKVRRKFNYNLPYQKNKCFNLLYDRNICNIFISLQISLNFYS